MTAKPRKNNKPVQIAERVANAPSASGQAHEGDLPEKEFAAYLRSSAEVVGRIALSMLEETGASGAEIESINRDPTSWIQSIPTTLEPRLGLAQSTSDMERLIDTQRGKEPNREVVHAHSLVAAVTLATALDMSRSAVAAIDRQHLRTASRETIHAWNMLLDAGNRVNALGAAFAIARRQDHQLQLKAARKQQNTQRSEQAQRARELATKTLFPEWRKANPDADAVDGYEHVASVLTAQGYKNANGAAITRGTVKGYFRKSRTKRLTANAA